MNYCLFTPKMTVTLRFILIVLYLYLSAGLSLFAQEGTADSTGSEALIEKGIKFHDEGKYNDARSCFAKVNYCDPNYGRALFETAITLNAQDETAEALKKCDEAIALHFSAPPLFSLKGSLLDQLGKPREGAAVIDSALKTWPYNQNLLFNLGVCLANMNEPEKAEKVLLRSLRINPYHPGSNMALAKMNLFMGRTGQAYLAFNMGVLLNPQVSALTQYENAIFGKYDSLIHSYRFSYRDMKDSAKWKELAMLLQSGFPYREDFEFPYKPDFKVMRMSVMLFNSIAYDKADTGFYNQFYVRFFTEMTEKFGFGMFLNYCLKNIDHANVNEWLAKHKEEYEKFIAWAQSRINDSKYYAFSPLDETNGVTRQYYTDNGTLEAIGAMHAKDLKKEGEWITLDEDGRLKDRGSYADGKKTGQWSVFWPNATVQQKLSYHDDELDGTSSTYYDDGSKNGIYHFIEGKQVDREEHYASSGELNSFVTYVAGKEDGPAMANIRDSWFKRDYANTSGEINGPVTETWFNGARKFAGDYKNGLRDGIHRFWFANDSLEAEETFTRDTLRGAFRNYYKNGKLSQEGFYNDKGKLRGIFKIYSRNGELNRVDSTYTNGLMNGTRTEYYPTGRKKEVAGYAGDEMVWLKSFDSAGKMIYQSDLKNGLLHYKSFYPDGRTRLAGDYMNDKQHGEWITYSPAGNKVNLTTYVDGELTGLQVKYHKNGKVKEQFTSDSSRIVGPYLEYSTAGKVTTRGFYTTAGATGAWTTYYPDDSIESMRFMADGHPVGRQVNRTQNHHTDTEIYFEEDGTDTGTGFFDRNGKKTQDWNYRHGESEGIDRYPGGDVYRVIRVKDNQRNGMTQFYYPNGKLRQEVPYIAGKIDGIMKTWDPAGNLLIEIPYRMGEWNGIRKDYEDGKLAGLVTMEDNNLQGTGTDYHNNGQISRMIAYTDDVRNGNSDYFAPNGTMMYRILYWNDFIVGYACPGSDGKMMPFKPVTAETTEMSTTYPDGKPSMKAGLRAGTYHGKYTSWYPDGTVFREANYDNDEEEGVFNTFYPGKILKETITYKDGFRNGKYSLYHPNGKIRLRGSFCYNEEVDAWELFDETGRHTTTYFYDYGKLYEIRTY